MDELTMLADIQRTVYPEEVKVTHQLHVMVQARESSQVIYQRSTHCTTCMFCFVFGCSKKRAILRKLSLLFLIVLLDCNMIHFSWYYSYISLNNATSCFHNNYFTSLSYMFNICCHGLFIFMFVICLRSFVTAFIALLINILAF